MADPKSIARIIEEIKDVLEPGEGACLKALLETVNEEADLVILTTSVDEIVLLSESLGFGRNELATKLIELRFRKLKLQK